MERAENESNGRGQESEAKRKPSSLHALREPVGETVVVCDNRIRTFDGRRSAAGFVLKLGLRYRRGRVELVLRIAREPRADRTARNVRLRQRRPVANCSDFAPANTVGKVLIVISEPGRRRRARPAKRALDTRRWQALAGSCACRARANAQAHGVAIDCQSKARSPSQTLCRGECCKLADSVAAITIRIDLAALLKRWEFGEIDDIIDGSMAGPDGQSAVAIRREVAQGVRVGLRSVPDDKYRHHHANQRPPSTSRPTLRHARSSQPTAKPDDPTLGHVTNIERQDEREGLRHVV